MWYVFDIAVCFLFTGNVLSCVCLVILLSYIVNTDTEREELMFKLR